MASRKNKRTRRAFRPEALERRSLLAGLTGCSPWTNPDTATDLNADGSVSPIDALVAINALNQDGSGSLSSRFAPPQLRGKVAGAAQNFLDSNGDSELTPIDALLVINWLNRYQSSQYPLDDSNDASESGGSLASDQQPEVPGSDAPVLELTNGFARVRSAINTAGDVDVFQVTPTETELSIALFARPSSGLTVVLLDSAGNEVSVTTESSGRHGPAKIEASVDAGVTYYLQVSASGDATGRYGLGVMNFASDSFAALADGEDIRESTLTIDAETTDSADSGDTNSTDDSTATDDASTTDDTGAGDASDGSTDGSTTDDATTEDTAPDGSTTDDSTTDDGTTDEPDETPPSLADLFAKIDADGDGSITLAEVAALPLPPQLLSAAEERFTAADTDGSGGLSLEEFTAAMPVLPPPPEMGGPGFEGRPHGRPNGGHHGGPIGGGTHMSPGAFDPAASFARLDANSDGSLTVEELSALPLPTAAAGNLAAAFAQADTDGDGGLSVEEFTATVTPPDGFPSGRGGHHHSGRPTPPTETTEPLDPAALFAKLDADSSGGLSKAELAAAAHSPRMIRVLDQIFAGLDDDGSGAIDLTEFTGGVA